MKTLPALPLLLLAACGGGRPMERPEAAPPGHAVLALRLDRTP